MDDAVTVFVDDAVTGRLPSICVKDGVVTGDRVAQRLEIGSRDLGIAWLLVFFGPIGWILLVAMSSRTPPEVLRVVLPLSEAAWDREGGARRAYRRALGLAALGGIGLFAFLVLVSSASPPLRLLMAVASLSALVGGIVGLVLAQRRLNESTVDLELDASRRWVTIWRVHPDFAAAATRQYEDSLDG